MEKNNRSYIAIDLKSFYASVECVDRGFDPLDTNLVVADLSRTEKTICLAVSPSLKAYGLPGRARLFEVNQKVREINAFRLNRIKGTRFAGKSSSATELERHPAYELEYIAAPPRMSRYIECSLQIHNIYLKYVSSEDIHVYSIDEVFIDATPYLRYNHTSAREFAATIVKDIYDTTGITATAGIGTNLYLCKIAMDIVAKHIEPDENGARIAELDEMEYRRLLWSHKPITDFWRVGKGYARRLHKAGLYTMGDIARCSIGGSDEYYNEELLYKMFGKNAELLIDHAWGWEPCELKHIKNYKPRNSSLSTGQVLKCPYSYKSAELIVKEMSDALSLNLAEKGLMSDQIVLMIGYDKANLSDTKYARGTVNLTEMTSSTETIMKKTVKLYNEIVNRNYTIRRISITANNIIAENDIEKAPQAQQISFFDCDSTDKTGGKTENNSKEREKQEQRVINAIKKKFGGNAILRGISLEEEATARERNEQIGGHRA